MYVTEEEIKSNSSWIGEYGMFEWALFFVWCSWWGRPLHGKQSTRWGFKVDIMWFLIWLQLRFLVLPCRIEILLR